MKMKDIRIRDLNFRAVITVNEKSSFDEVIATMKENNINHVPVVNDEGNLVGILSSLDVYRNLLKLSLNTSGKTYSKVTLNSILAKEIMTLEPVQLKPEDSAYLAAEILFQGKFHAIPIVSNNKIKGIITSKDILEHITDYELTV